jgi:dUTP pyrophosphatase
MEKALVKTDIQIALPSGCYGRVAPRSGLAAKHFIDVAAGVIDEDYREILVLYSLTLAKRNLK